MSRDILILNRIAWGKSYLKKGGYLIYPKRGMVQITNKGKKSIKQKLQLKDIENEDNFLTFYSEEKNKALSTSDEIKNSTPQDLIDEGFSQIESKVKSELLEGAKNGSDWKFKDAVIEIFEKLIMHKNIYLSARSRRDEFLAGVRKLDTFGEVIP